MYEFKFNLYLCTVRFFRSAIWIICISGIALPGDAVRFIFHLPAVVQHYQHHNAIGEPVSFVEFIHEHMFEEFHPEHEKNHPDHEKLPFDHHAHTGIHIPYIPHYYSLDLKCFYILQEQQPVPLRESFAGTEILSNIWQPPRMS